MARELTVDSGAKWDELGDYIAVLPSETDLMFQMLSKPSGGENAEVSTSGVKIAGFQGGAIDKTSSAHLQFKFRAESDHSAKSIPSGAAMKDNYEGIDIDEQTGRREWYSKTTQTNAFLQSQMNVDLQKRAISKLRRWVEWTPYAAQFMYGISPIPSTINGMSTVATFWTAIRTTTFQESIVAVMDDPNIGAPGGTACTTAANRHVVAAFPSVTQEDILRSPSGAFTGATDDNFPTFKNLRPAATYYRSQNWRIPTNKLLGQSLTGLIVLVPPTFNDVLEDDDDMKDIRNWIEPKGDANTALKGVGRVRQLHGMYFVEYAIYHKDFPNNWPGYSHNISNGMAIYACPVLSAGSYATSMFEKPKATFFRDDHNTWQLGIYAVIGTVQVKDLITDQDAETTSWRSRVGYLNVVCPRQGTTATYATS